MVLRWRLIACGHGQDGRGGFKRRLDVGVHKLQTLQRAATDTNQNGNPAIAQHCHKNLRHAHRVQCRASFSQVFVKTHFALSTHIMS